MGQFEMHVVRENINLLTQEERLQIVSEILLSDMKKERERLINQLNSLDENGHLPDDGHGNGDTDH
jgi:hypothetical protein